MTDAGFFRGTSSEQDNRFSDKEKKLLKQMKFADNLTTKIEMNKIKLDVIKPWISKRICELLGMEDDVVVEFVINQLEAEKHPDARKIQINLTGFLNGKNARIFMGELWGMLISAQESSVGIPASMVEAKKEEIKKRNEEQERINESLKRTVSRFADRLKQERDSPPSSGRREHSSEPTSRDNKGRSRSKERDSKSHLPPKSGDSEDNGSKSREDSSNKRNYRSRRSSSPSPDGNHKRRSRSTSRDRRPDRRPPREEDMRNKERDRDRDRRGGPDRGRDFRDRPPPRSYNRRSRSRSPFKRGGRSRSRSPARIVIPDRRMSPQRGNGARNRLPFHESRNRPDYSQRGRERDYPARRDSSGDRFRKRSSSRSPIRDRSDGEAKKLLQKASPETEGLGHSNKEKTINRRSHSPEPVAKNSNKATPELVPRNSQKTSSSSEESSSSADRKSDKSDLKRKASDATSDSEGDQPVKRRKEKKKKEKKKHKKHRKHKKTKKSKQKSSSEEDDDKEDPNDESEGEQGTPENAAIKSSKMAKSFLKLVEPQSNSSEDLERKLREKALESMKKSMNR